MKRCSGKQRRRSPRKKKKRLVELIQDGTVLAVIDIGKKSGRKIRNRMRNSYDYECRYIGRV